jgi:CxxC motif-containing protein (DUF1111 family)
MKLKRVTSLLGHRAWWLCGGFAALLAIGTATAKEPDQPGDHPEAVSDEAVDLGRELFARVWMPRDPRSHGGDGLGPVFNGQSCLGCHDQGGPGGAGGLGRNIEIATATGFGAGGPGYGFSYAFAMDFGAGRFEYRIGNAAAPQGKGKANGRRGPVLDPNVLALVHPGFRASPSVVLHRFGIDADYHVWRTRVAGPHGTFVVQTSERNPTPLFGAGLIDAIPDEAIEAAARRKAGPGARVKGRVSRVEGGRIGRFGWKAQTATLAEFANSAAATEIGLEVPGQHQAADPRIPGVGAPGLDMDQAECNALVAYVRSLPPPVARKPADEKEAAAVRAGEATFRSIGCDDCHLPKLGEVEGIYSDLLLHDMGTRLADTGSYGVFVAGPNAPRGGGPRDEPAGVSSALRLQEWRTPPLWGIRDSAPYLHDGRAATLDQAITLHGGQGASSAHRYGQLTTRRKQQLEAFLKSLSAPDRDGQLARLP